jgi:hypothetical protein
VWGSKYITPLCITSAALDGNKWSVSGPSHVTPEKELPITILLEAVQALGPVWTLWRKRNLLFLLRIEP